MQQEENNTVDIDTSGPGAEIELENDSKETETPEEFKSSPFRYKIENMKNLINSSFNNFY